ncbi:hypothetical protein CK203_062351 [Vitis vinifera]|uniref:Uncharacterized protein n=1 Tax=Vitis vinifera TaxID=29760 RepID=A0A438G5R3_VITVI|nr:hypothetical protein CK203_062351 [Vitis vinifera]
MTSSACPHTCPPFQLVTKLPDSIKGGATGHVVVRGAWAGLLEHPAEAFLSKLLLGGSGSGIEGPPCRLGGKASFACLSKLFEIDAKERHYKTLLTARNLTAIVGSPKSMLSTFSPENAKGGGAWGALYCEGSPDLPGAPGQKRDADSSPKKAPARKRKLVKKNGKGVKEPTPPKEFAPPPITHEAEHLPGTVARLANVAEEAASINHPGNLNPDVEAAEAVCDGATLKEARSVRNLRSEILGRLQDRSKRLKLVAHPPTTLIRRGRSGVVTETPAIPVMVPAEVAPGETHPAVNVEAPHPEQKSPSAASSGGNLLMTQLAPPLALLAMRMSGLRGMAQQHDLFADLLRTTDYMKIFASRHKESENQLRLRLEEAEASLSTIRKDNEALRVDLAEAKSREESTADRLHEAQMRWPS